MPEAWYDAPTFYFTNPYAVIGAHDDVPVPPGSEVLDFELEVAAVIGREGRDLTPEQARDHIIGYTVFNDWSARDLQSREMQVRLGPCKGKDTAATLGPYLVTADELEPYRDTDGFLRLALTASVNGEVVGKDLLSNMSWTFEEMVAYASRGTVVRPGDVLGSGTCGNGGCLAELWGVRGEQSPPPLKPGDTVTLTVEGIGTVSNTVVAGRDPQPLPTARRRTKTCRSSAETRAAASPPRSADQDPTTRWTSGIAIQNKAVPIAAMMATGRSPCSITTSSTTPPPPQRPPTSCSSPSRIPPTAPPAPVATLSFTPPTRISGERIPSPTS